MFVALSYIQVAASAVDDYVAARRNLIDPALDEQPGFVSSFLLRPRDGDDPLRLALVNSWADLDQQIAFVRSPLRAELHARTARLVQRIDSRLYQRLDDVSIQVGDPATAAMWSIGTHDVVPGRGPEYLANRRDVSNPDMGKAPGFVGLMVHADPDDENRYLNVFQWASDAAADGYYDSPSHLGTVYEAIAAPLTGPPLPTPRYDLLLAHSSPAA